MRSATRRIAVSSSENDALARAETLLAAVAALVATHEHCAEEPWLGEVFDTWRRHGLDAERFRPFAELVAALSDPIGRRMTIASYGVVASDGAHTQVDLIAAVERAAAGQKPFGLMPFGKPDVRHLRQHPHPRQDPH